MPEIEIIIDHKTIKAEQGANLLKVAREAGFEIPGLCFHPRLSPTGACRLCAVKVEGLRGIQMACALSVTDAMQITAFDDELEEIRRNNLDYLLSEHNPEFDPASRNELVELAIRYKMLSPENRHLPDLRKELYQPDDLSSPVLNYRSDRCIKCFRCIKACDEIQGKGVLSMASRGVNSFIIAGFADWKDSECDGCGECIQLCPTGAIVEKPHAAEVDLSKSAKWVRTTCPYCGVGCQISLLVSDQKILRANGVEGVMPNQGRLCVKGRFGYEYVQSPERLRHPLIRKNGKLHKASWDEALGLIAARFSSLLEKYGNESLAGYASAKATNEDNYVFQKFIRRVFRNNNVDYCTRLCHASTVTAMIRAIGDGAGSNPIEDFENADCLLVTGNNIIETHPITATYIKRGARKGMKIIVIDPRYTPLVRYARIWLQPRLGTDVALLNGLMNVIINKELYNSSFIESRVEGGLEAFEALKSCVMKYTPEFVEEITGVPSAKIIEAAEMYATAGKAIIATGMGMSQQVTGTHNVFALINMMLISGQIGKEGAGIDPPRGQNNVQGATDVGCSPMMYPGYIPVIDDANRQRIADLWNCPLSELNAKPGLTTVEIVKAAHDGIIKGLYIMGENPMMSDPNLNHTREAFENLDFLVVQDIFLTETAALADVVLPATAFAEKNGTTVSSDRRVLRTRKALDPPGEARQDWRIVCAIADRIGVTLGNWKNESEIFDEIAQAAPIMGGISHQRLETEELQWPCPYPDHPGTPTLYLDGFNTATGKGKLFPVDHEPQEEQPNDDFPFLLNTGRLLYHYHTSTMTRKVEVLRQYGNSAFILINPLDAAKCGLSERDVVKLANRRGSLEAEVHIDEGVLPGELFMPFHFSEALVNSLTSDDLDPYSKIAAFKRSAVSIEKISQD
jgi:formate dehydrogenase alpha subunit